MKPVKAIGYVRCSTDEQADSGLGLEAQRNRIVAFATARGFDLVDIREDAGFSAGDMNRPAIQGIIDEGSTEDRKFDAVIVLKIDRLTRRIRDMLDFVEWCEKVDLAFCAVEEQFDTTTAMGRFVLNIVASIAQLEREQISERTKQALDTLRRNGRRVGMTGAAFGFRLIPGKGLMVVPDEIEIVDLVFRLRYIEGYTYGGIRKYLDLHEIPFIVGSSASRSSIDRRLKNGIYLNVISHEARVAAEAAGVERVPMPVDSVYEYRPELLKGD